MNDKIDKIMKHVIIGGVAGGATAAARIRRADETAEIVLLEKGNYISYANCGLPYYIGGVISDRSKLFVQTPEAFSQRFNIDVRTRHEVTEIHADKRTLSVKRPDGTIYEETYDRLLLSPGSYPLRPQMPGIDLPGIFTLRDVGDTDAIKDYLYKHHAGHAVIVGGGFIGLEMADNLKSAGIQVSIVEQSDQVMGPVDFSIASFVHRELMAQGVGLYLGQGVTHFGQVGEQIDVFLSSGESIRTDLVLLSIGVRPHTKLAAEAGIKIGQRGIQVDRYLETSVKGIYAVGDAIEFPHPLTGKPWLNYLAGPANRQARIAADNMVFGNKETYEGAVGTSIAKVFDLTVGATGLAAKTLRKEGTPYLSSTTTSPSHAGYYPGAFPLVTKLVFEPKTGRLLGAQCVGHDGVDKRIDQLSLVIKHNGTVYDLIQLEQAYAPPYSSAKDPLAIAGYTASNILSGAMPVVYWREIRDNKKEICLIDVRTEDEYQLGSIEGAVNIPLDHLRERISEVPQDRPVVVFCAIGLRGYLALRILSGRGYKNVRNLSGGYQLYKVATQKICRELPHDTNDGVQTGVQKTQQKVLKVDACGLQCPGPILKLKRAMDGLQSGNQIEVVATDPGFPKDVRAWCQSTGNQLVASNDDNGYHKVVIEKGSKQTPGQSVAVAGNKSFILFSDDLDRAIATFVLANGAAATGTKVSIFFTFWGLNVIKKQHKPSVKKDFFGRMFSWMLPSDSTRLKLSKLNMMGIGGKLMRHLMRKKNISSLEELRQQAMDNGVEFIACQMTMDIMGIHREELLDGVTVGGVATYMQRAEQSNVNLFI